MRLLCASVLAAFLSVLPLPLGGDGLLQAKIVCGMFDGKFGCKTAPGGAQYGKNAAPGAKTETPDESPEGITGEQNPTDPAAGPGSTGQGTSGGNARCGYGLPTRHGRHATQLPVPEELGIIGRQLRALHRVGMQQRASLRRPPPSLRGGGREAVLHNEAGWIEGLLLFDLRQILSSELSVSRRGSPRAGRCRTPRPTSRRGARASGARRRQACRSGNCRRSPSRDRI